MKTGEEKGTRTILFYQIIKLIILESSIVTLVIKIASRMESI